ncbi:hypothetical protein CEXT_135021 [Caerostris extrusa]|uniref:Ycf15 n=1 Tax=Caerostris extrusa TaxID=172846 RepID=A0AAV4W0V4_CAEEX|nr:hypothetical protein CEXT_135021 [Caerostris extrusa]
MKEFAAVPFPPIEEDLSHISSSNSFVPKDTRTKKNIMILFAPPEKRNAHQMGRRKDSLFCKGVLYHLSSYASIAESTSK